MPDIKPNPSLALWTLVLEGGHATASRGDEVVSASCPAVMWQTIAARSDGGFVQISETGTRTNRAALGRSAATMERDGLDAVIGRARYGDGTVSAHLKQIEMTRYVEIPQGTVLARSDALARLGDSGLRGRFDEFWTYDLANALALGGLAAAEDEIFADLPGPAPALAPRRMPFARACHLHAADPEEPKILVYGRIEATTSIYFDGLPVDLRANLRFLRPGDLASDIAWLASASLVIVVRDFEHMLVNGTRDLLAEIGVPYFWFTDDDLIALGTEVSAFRIYNEALVRSFAAGATGVIGTSPALTKSLARFSNNVVFWPCLYERTLAPGAPSPLTSDLRVGAFGGAFRRRSFIDHVQPALRNTRRYRSISVFANAGLARDSSDVIPLAFQKSFRSFVWSWQRLGLNALVHPYGETANIANKSPASLLAAAYLGAVPIVGHETAYEAFTEEIGVLKAGPDSGAWQAEIERISDPVEYRRLYGLLDAWCREAFDPENARGTFEACLGFALSGSTDQQALRRQQANRSNALRKAVAATPARRRLLSLWRRIKARWR